MKRLLVAGAAVLALCPFSGLPATFTVTNNFDTGAGSFNQAILDANASAGANTIAFNIPGGGVQIIEPYTWFPVVTNQVTIDGTTQPGYSGAPLIVLDGDNGIDALTISAPGCAIKGMVFGGFGQSYFSPSAALVLLSPSNTVTACYVGISETGAAVRFNDTTGILISNASGNVIGGLGATNRNLIGGNLTGVFITGPNASNNVILGNWFSLSQDGSTPLVNNPTDIIISNAPNNTIGGTIAAARNVLAAKEQDIIVNGGATGNAILGNYLDLLPDGSPDTNSNPIEVEYGILVQNATGTIIGGSTAGARNVISGCVDAVEILEATTSGTVVQGNYLGTDPAGMTADFNYEGVSIQGSSGNLIGGTAPGAGNVIVGKGIAAVTIQDLVNYDYFGVVFNEGASNNVVQGNFIGTDASGMKALLNNGTLTDGVGIFGTRNATTDNLIGGLTPGARNVISGLTADGVQINGATASNNIVQGNYIGVAADGLTALGNAGNGVDMYGANSNWISGNLIGNNGTSGASGVLLYYGSTNNLVFQNTIFSNTISGVAMFGPNVISQNSIYGNGGLGISSGGFVQTVNTPDGNNNYPVLTSVRHGSTDIDGNLAGNPNCFYVIEFAWNPIPTSTGNVGAVFTQYLGSWSGPPGPFHFSSPTSVPEGVTITATATSTCIPPETSEISFPYTIIPATTPRPPPTVGTPTVAAGQIQIPVSSPGGENIVIKTTDDIRVPLAQWKTAQVLSATAGFAFLKTVTGILEAYYMAVLSGPSGNVMVTVSDTDGNPMAGATLSVGSDQPPGVADEDGNIEYDGYPAGLVDLVFQWQLTGIYAGIAKTFTHGISFPVTVMSGSANEFPIKVALPEPLNSTPPACGCTPWCAMMAGMVGGVEQLQISGGADGSCTDTANVQVTPPSGPIFTLGAGQTLLETPAADGTWTVSSTVCGVTQTAQITIP